MSTKLPIFALLAFAAFGAVGCAADAEDIDGPVFADEDELLRQTAITSKWSYHGIMPELESPSLTVSLKGHTVHVTGLLPKNHRERLPFHAKTEDAPNGRTRVHVVYPIATVNPRGTLPNGLPTRNPEPDDYKVCNGSMFAASNSIGSFGGFPFIEYVCNHRDADGRVRSGIAFHGPITDKDVGGTDYWYLQRGPVSHACNRMLGEHVLELAHVIGFDRGVRNAPVKVIAGFDKFQGKTLDVDYPAKGWTRPADAIVFPIWQAVKQRADGSTALDFPRWACETSRCASMPPNATDPFTGRPL